MRDYVQGLRLRGCLGLVGCHVTNSSGSPTEDPAHPAVGVGVSRFA